MAAAAPAEPKDGDKIWVEDIKFEVVGNLGVDRWSNTYTNQPTRG